MATCADCQRQIRGEVSEFRGKQYHPNCFKCADCKTVLTDRVLVKDGRNICENCHDASKRTQVLTTMTTSTSRYNERNFATSDRGSNSNVCGECRTPLSGSIKTFEGRKFHADCFKCDGCRDTLSGHIYPMNGRHYCNNCMLDMRQAEQNQRQMETHSKRTQHEYENVAYDHDDADEIFDSPGDCQQCRRPVEEQFFVRIDENVWHTSCFKCRDCKAVLDPKQHSLLPDGITRLCYECDPSKRCTTCNDVIYGEATEFKGQPYHPQCFTCEGCDSLLTGRVIVKDGRNMCEDCHQKDIEEREDRIHKERQMRSTAATVAIRTDRRVTIHEDSGFDFECSGNCTNCRMPIEDRLFVKFDDQLLHRACFKCAVCEGVLDPQKHSTLPDRRRVCFGCDPEKQCDKCHDVIWEDAAEFKGRRFHPDCFTCEECDVPLLDRVIIKDGKNLCERCHENIREMEERNRPDEYECVGICTKCRDPIEDKFYVRLDDGMMHKNCFRCHNCRVELDPKAHSVLDNGTRVCYNCDPSKECQKCFQTIFEDAAEFKGKRYHPSCFRCDDCNALLSNHVVVRDNRNICEPCWHTIQEEQERNHKDEYECAGICTSCRSPIEDKFYVRLDDGLFHTDCFKCNTCKVDLDPKEHSVLADRRTRVCYNCDPSKQCDACHRVIKEEATEFKGRRYHPRCFNCEECRRALSDQVVVKDGRNVCEPCYDKIREREERNRKTQFECVGYCDVCNKSIEDQFFVRLDDGLVHKSCFRCGHCKIALDPKKLSVLREDGKATRVCFNCDPSKKCQKCRRVIDEEATEYKGERFHPNCFSCDDCRTPLTDRVFVKDNGRFCEKCVKKPNRNRVPARQEPVHEMTMVTRDRPNYQDMIVKATPLRSGRPDTNHTTANIRSDVQTKTYVNKSDTMCDVCRDPIKDQYFVRVEDKQMHKQCFKCNTCKVILDPKFHTTMHDGRTRICYRCDPSKQCDACRRTIFEDASEFKGKRYHPKCFTCDGCSAHLTGRVFMKDGLKYCEECKNSGNSNWRTGQVMTNITSSNNGYPSQVQTTTYSPKYGAPNQVQTTTLSSPRNGNQTQVMTSVTQRLSSSDQNSACTRCRAPLSGSVVNYDSKKYHKDCFRCDGCNGNLSGNVYPSNGRNYCKDCKQQSSPGRQDSFQSGQKYADRCAGCNSFINGTCKAVANKKFHPECFVCSECRNIVAGSFGMRGQNVVCTTCLRR